MLYVQKIKHLIGVKKISQRELAKMINKTHQTVNNYLSGKTSIDVDTLIDIGKALKIDPCIFFKEEDINEKNFINGNYNNIGSDNSISIKEKGAEYKGRYSELEKEVMHLKERLADKDIIIEQKDKTIKDKEQIIKLLKNE